MVCSRHSHTGPIESPLFDNLWLFQRIFCVIICSRRLSETVIAIRHSVFYWFHTTRFVSWVLLWTISVGSLKTKEHLQLPLYEQNIGYLEPHSERVSAGWRDTIYSDNINLRFYLKFDSNLEFISYLSIHVQWLRRLSNLFCSVNNHSIAHRLIA